MPWGSCPRLPFWYRMPHGVRRHHIGQRLLVVLVVLLGKALEHGVIVDGGFCCPVFFHLVLFLAFRHAPFHDGKSLDTLIAYYNTRKALFHYIVSRESMIFSNCFRLIWMRLPFRITQPVVGGSSASRRSLFSPIRKYLDASLFHLKFHRAVKGGELARLVGTFLIHTKLVLPVRAVETAGAAVLRRSGLAVVKMVCGVIFTFRCVTIWTVGFTGSTSVSKLNPKVVNR